MQTGWRLERTYLAGAGFPESRLEGLDINWSDPLEPTGHAALWADNGTGKTTITALRFALYLPNTRDFVRGNSDRSLARLVYSGRVCHVVEQATRQVSGELQRIVVGMVAHWGDGGSQDLDNPSKLHREFYGWVTGPQGPTIDDLPFRTSVGRWATRTQFVDAVRSVVPSGGALPPYPPSSHQTQWRQWLAAAGVDLEQIRFQAEMNASEGGVDHVMQFPDSDGFVKWLIGAITQTSTTEQITRSIDALRANAAARPRWADELALWDRVIEPLLQLAIVHEEVAANRRAAATAEAQAGAVVADANVTAAALSAEKDAADTHHAEHEQRRRDATAMLRRAQAHRLRMQLRAAKLRADAARAIALRHEHHRDAAVRNLAAWQLVTDVIDAKEIRHQVTLLTGRLDAAEKQTAELRNEEARHRHNLARLLTDRRDRAAADLAKAQHLRGDAAKALERLEKDLHKAVVAHAKAEEQARQAHQDAAKSEQKIAEIVAAGLLPEDTDPVAHDARLAEQAEAARQALQAARQALESIDNQTAYEPMPFSLS